MRVEDNREFLAELESGAPDCLEAVPEHFRPQLLHMAEHHFPLYLCGRFDGDDVVRHAMISFTLGVRKRKCQFNCLADVFALLETLVREKVNYLRREHHQHCRDVTCEISLDAPIGETDRSFDPADHHASPLDEAIADDDLEHLLKRLPAKYHAIVRRKLDGYTIQEVAGRLGCSARLVDKVLAAARKIWVEIDRGGK